MIRPKIDTKELLEPEQLFNIFCFFNALIVFFHLSIFSNIGISTTLFWLDIFCFLFLSFSFCLSYFFNKYKLIYWPFVYGSLFLVSFLWFQLNGIKGPCLLLFFLLSIFYKSLLEEGNNKHLVFIVVFTIFTNIFLEHFNIVHVVQFETREIFLMNSSLILVLAIYSVALTANYIFLRYQAEHNALLSKSNELDQAVKDLQQNNEVLEIIRHFQNNFLKADNYRDSYGLLCDYLLESTASKYALLAEIHMVENNPIINVMYLSGEKWSKKEEVFFNENVDEWIQLNDLKKMLLEFLKSKQALFKFENDATKQFSNKFNNATFLISKAQGQVNGFIGFFDSDLKVIEYNKMNAFVTSFSTSIQNLRLKRSKKIYEKELNYAKEFAEENIRVKSLFLNNVSAELQQPLNIISGLIASILKIDETNYDENKVEKSLNLVLNNSNRILNYIDDIMSWARIRSNTLQLLKTKRNLHEFILEFLKTQQTDIEQSSSTFELHYNVPKNTEVYYDFNKIARILKVLLSNALSYTKNGLVQCIVKQVGSHIRIEIKDNGIGINHVHVDSIFERYSFLKNNNSYLKNGIGLGLSIAQELAKLQDFVIQVKSTLNEGSVFWFDLKQTEKFEPQKLSVATTKAQKSNIKLSESTGSYRILLVEDQQSMRLFVKSLLTEYTCDVAENGKQAIQFLKQHVYDLVITDLMMPVMNGYDLIKWMKSNENTAAIPLIVLTAVAGEESKIELLKIGVDEYLLKPFSVDELKIRISNVLSNSVARQKWNENKLDGWEKNQELLRSEIEKRTLSGEYVYSSHDREKLKDAELIILENLTDLQFSVDTFAHKIMMSKRQLYRFLKSKVGMTPLAFIKEVKLQNARKILEAKSNRNIKEIAQMSGFMTVRNFSKNYKDRFARTPNSYFKKE